MKNKYIFFRFDSVTPILNDYTMLLKEYQIEQFIPTFCTLKKHRGNILLYIFWFVITLGRYKIIYLRNNNEIVHYTHILPKFFKLPFLNFNDLEIGPSWTKESYRGKGIFPAVINYIIQSFNEKGRIFYAFTHVDNLASQKAIQKSGFHRWANGHKTEFFGIYKVDVI